MRKEGIWDKIKKSVIRCGRKENLRQGKFDAAQNELPIKIQNQENDTGFRSNKLQN